MSTADKELFSSNLVTFFANNSVTGSPLIKLPRLIATVTKMKNEKGKVLPCSEEPFNTETSKAIATIFGVSLTDRTKQIKPLEIQAIPFPT